MHTSMNVNFSMATNHGPSQVSGREKKKLNTVHHKGLKVPVGGGERDIWVMDKDEKGAHSISKGLIITQTSTRHTHWSTSVKQDHHKKKIEEHFPGWNERS